MELRYIHPSQLEGVDDFVREKCAEAIAISAAKAIHDSWNVDHVLADIRESRSQLFVIENNGPKGIVVTRLFTDDFDGTRSLHVWILAGEADLLRQYPTLIGELDVIAKNSSAKKITFDSARNPSTRFLRGLFQEKYCRYERLVSC